MKEICNGIWPTMITPYKKNGEIDYQSLKKLVNWYIEKGSDGLFAVCQSSEMFFLSLEERVRLANETVRLANGRVPVVASGHISDTMDDQKEELAAMAETGIDGLVMVTNRLATREESDDIWKDNFLNITQCLPKNLKLGFYECPYPYKRVFSIELLQWLNKTGKVCFIKDTCCQPKMIQERGMTFSGSNLKLFNANSATLRKSLDWGYSGFSGIMANFHPQLYSWLYRNRKESSELMNEISDFIGFASVLESRGYPVNAKHYLPLEGIDMLPHSRSSKISLTPSELLELEQFCRINYRYSAKTQRKKSE